MAAAATLNVLGSILASLVVLAFMRNARSTLIAAVAIPASLVSTFGMMRVFGFTLNSVTMAATADIGLAVMATTFSLVVIFLPVSFMSSISGRFLYQFGITASVAILVSLLVSFTLTPMMSARLLAGHVAHAEKAGEEPGSRRGFYHRIDERYARLLRWSMDHRKPVALLAVGVALSTFVILPFVSREFIPGNVDEAEFEVSVTAPEGTSLAAMDEAMRAVEAEIKASRGVITVLASVGGGFLGGVGQGDAFVQIKPHEERVFGLGRVWRETTNLTPWRAFYGNYSQRDVMQEIRGRLKKFPHLRCSVRNITSFNIGGGRTEIVIALRGPDIVTLVQSQEKLRELTRSGAIPGVVDADVGLQLDKPEFRIHVDRDRAADLGVDTTDVATSLRIMVGGDDRVTRFLDDTTNEDYDVQLRLDRQYRSDPETISRLYVPSQAGGLVRLDNVVRIESGFAPSRIERLDRQRTVRFFAGVGPGYALGDRLVALRKALADMNLPSTYSVTVLGRGREMERTFAEFALAFLLSIVFMYMILASQFFGIVKKNSILQIDHMNNLRRHHGLSRDEAVMQGNRDRLRPILMTTFALVAGMLPLALGTGPGAEERRSIAIVVIGGQTLSLLLTLLATPVFYTLFEDAASSPRWKALVGRVRPSLDALAAALKQRWQERYVRRTASR